jgi:hypothetical protein
MYQRKEDVRMNTKIKGLVTKQLLHILTLQTNTLTFQLSLTIFPS